MELLEKIARPRPVGTVLNQEITEYIGACLESFGYEVRALPFRCKVWETEESYLMTEGKKIPVEVSPYSEAFTGTGKAIVVKDREELKKAECENQLLFLTAELAQEPLQPKDYPFYYPDEHKELIQCLEEKKPCAVIAVTGETCMSGLKPFPLFEDGNFLIPSGSMDKEKYADMVTALQGKELTLSLFSDKKDAEALQLIASKQVPNPQGTIVICAHMDSKYHTDGALDNASGVATMLQAAKNIKSDKYNIEIVPFNSEEYYDPQGELLYLNEIQQGGKEITLLINIDTIAHVGSQNAVAQFNLEGEGQQELMKIIENSENMVSGEPWYAGDHAAFAFAGTKCILLSASDLFEGCLSYTHCPKDTANLVDEKLIEDATAFICKVVNTYA